MSVISIGLTAIEEYNGKPTAVQIDMTAEAITNLLSSDTASLESTVGIWGEITGSNDGTKSVSVLDRALTIGSSTRNNLLADEASIDGAVGWAAVTAVGTAGTKTIDGVARVSKGTGENLLSVDSAILSTIGTWTAATGTAATGAKTTSIVDVSTTGTEKNLLDFDTSALENSAGYWVAGTNAANVVQAATTPYYGTYAYQWNSTGTGSGQTSIVSSTTNSPPTEPLNSASAGNIAYASAYIKPATASLTNAKLGIRFYNGASVLTTVYGTIVASPSTSAWTQLTVTSTAAPATTTSYAVVIEATKTAALQVMYFDKVNTNKTSTTYYAPGTMTSSSGPGLNYGLASTTSASSGVMRVQTGVVGSAVTTGQYRSAIASVATISAFQATQARVGIWWDGTTQIDWGTQVSLAAANTWYTVQVSAAAPVSNTGFRVVIEYTTSSAAVVYFDAVCANVGATPAFTHPTTSAIAPTVGDGYGVVTGYNPSTGTMRIKTSNRYFTAGSILSASISVGSWNNQITSARIGIAWSGTTIVWGSPVTISAINTWYTAEVLNKTAPVGVSYCNVIVEFTVAGSGIATGGVFEKACLNAGATVSWSYPGTTTIAAVGSSYGVLTTYQTGSGTIRAATSDIGATSPGDTRSTLASFSRGDSNITSARVGILWNGAGTITWGNSVTITATNAWFESKVDGAIAPALTTGFSTVIEFTTTGATTAAYFDKVSASASTYAAHGAASARALRIVRSMAGYPADIIVDDPSFLGSTSYIDRTVPLDSEITYNVSWGDDFTSESITLEGIPTDDEVCYPCLISDPTNPPGVGQIQAATLQIYRPFEYNERQGVYEIVGSNYPIVLSGRRSASRGNITYITHTALQAQKMREIFSTGRVLLFRVASSAREEKPSAAIAVGKVTEQPVILTDITRAERKWSIDFTEVALPTVDELFLVETVWSDIPANYTTWGALVANIAEAPNWSYVVNNPAVATP